MNLINPKSNGLENIIRPINETIILGLAKIAFKCNKDTERYNLRDELYISKYSSKNLENKESELENFIKLLQDSNIRLKKQNKEYNWVIINADNIGDTSSRFYIAPNPNNMHEMVQKLTEIFSNQNVSVKFKYQLTTGMELCDRIIIYSDVSNKDKIENVIRTVYQKNPYLFSDCERSVAWVYDTSIPNVYYAPETPGDAYSNRLADVILEAKQTFNFLYGLTNSNPKINVNEKDAVEYMKLLISSIMLRKGLLLTKDGKYIYFDDKMVNLNYSYETGVLEHFNIDEKKYYNSVYFFPTDEGRKALLNNFYEISTIQPQNGLELKYLSSEQHKEETKKYFHSSNNIFPKIR